MNSEQFERELVGQNDHLRMQLAALGRKPMKIRDKYVAHRIRCSECGDVVIELITLDPYPVIRYRRSTAAKSRVARDDFPSMAEFAQAFVQRKRSIRRENDWRFTPIPVVPTDDESRSLIMTACRCANERVFTVAGIRARAAEGAASTARPPRH